jgi:hypothetical protein
MYDGYLLVRSIFQGKRIRQLYLVLFVMEIFNGLNYVRICFWFIHGDRGGHISCLWRVDSGKLPSSGIDRDRGVGNISIFNFILIQK